jgi:hypothetical protein
MAPPVACAARSPEYRPASRGRSVAIIVRDGGRQRAGCGDRSWQRHPDSNDHLQGVGLRDHQGRGVTMIALPTDVRVWLAAGHTDMRRGMNGPARQVQVSGPEITSTRLIAPSFAPSFAPVQTTWLAPVPEQGSVPRAQDAPIVRLLSWGFRAGKN